MTRQEMIDELINSSHRWSAEQDIDWKTYILVHGLKGFSAMTDEEVTSEWNEMKEEESDIELLDIDLSHIEVSDIEVKKEELS